MNLSEQLVFKPGDDQQAKIATQTLLHMDCNVMSDQQVTNLLRASQHPWLTGAKLVKQRKELMQEEDLVELKQYAGEMLKTFESWEKDGWTSSATGIKYDVQLYVTGDMKWLRTVCGQKSAGADHFCYMCLCHKNDRGDLSRMGHPMRDSATADKTTPGMAHDRSLFHFVPMNRNIRSGKVISGFKIRPNRDTKEMEWHGLDRGKPLRSLFEEVYRGNLDFTSLLAPGRWQRIQSFWKAWWQQFRKINTPTPFEPAAALLWQSQTRKVFRDATSPAVQPEHPKIVSGEWKVEMEAPWLHVKEYKYRCTLCARRFVYQKCFKTHMADCRQDEPDISDVINVDKSHFWEQCDFVAANEDD
eukprot:g22661.t1